MTGVGRCVQGDSEGMLRSEWQNKRAFLFRLYIRLSVPEGEGTTWLKSARANKASGCAALDEVLAVDAGAGEEYVGYMSQVG